MLHELTSSILVWMREVYELCSNTRWKWSYLRQEFECCQRIYCSIVSNLQTLFWCRSITAIWVSLQRWRIHKIIWRVWLPWTKPIHLGQAHLNGSQTVEKTAKEERWWTQLFHKLIIIRRECNFLNWRKSAWHLQKKFEHISFCSWDNNQLQKLPKEPWKS